MWTCKNKCSWSGGMPLCIPCALHVLGLKVHKHPNEIILWQSGMVDSDGVTVGKLDSFEGFSCTEDGKPLAVGTTPECPHCNEPVFWEDLVPTPAKVKANAKVVEPTTQDMKALDYINKYMGDHAYPPTIREIMVACEYSSSSAAFRGRQRLVGAKLLTVVNGTARGIQGTVAQSAMEDDTLPKYACLGCGGTEEPTVVCQVCHTLISGPPWVPKLEPLCEGCDLLQESKNPKPFHHPLFTLTHIMQSWSTALEKGQVNVADGGGVCLIVPNPGTKDGEGSNAIIWFATPDAAKGYDAIGNTPVPGGKK